MRLRCGSKSLVSAMFFGLGGQALCDGDSDAAHPERKSEKLKCDEINTFWQRMRPGGRDNRCIETYGCSFIGDGQNGKCLPIEEVESLQKENTVYNVYAELEQDDDRLPTIKVLVREAAVESAVESLKDAEALAKVLSKDLVLDAMQADSSRHQLGLFLQNIFSYESVLSPTRWLVYSSIASPSVVTSAEHLVLSQRDYFLRDDAQPYTRDQLQYLAEWWLGAPASRSTVVAPLVLSTLRDPVNVTKPLSDIVKDALLCVDMRRIATENLTWCASESLKYEGNRRLVRDAVVSYLVDRSRHAESESESESGSIEEAADRDGSG